MTRFIAMRQFCIPLLASLVLIASAARSASAGLRPLITEQDVRQYAKWLRLDEDQKSIAQSLFERHCAVLEQDFLPRLQAWGAEQYRVVRLVNADTDANTGALAKEHFPPLMKKEELLEAEQETLERAFFDELASILREDQVPLMQRVISSRERAEYRRISREPAGGNVDLIALVDGLNLPHELQLVADEFLLDFEPIYIAALGAAVGAQRRSGIEQWTLSELTFALRNANDDDERAAIRHEMAKVRDRAGRDRAVRSEQLIRVIATGMADLRQILPPEHMAVVDERFRREAYPRIYPDDGSAEILFNTALALGDLSDEQRNSIEQLKASWHYQQELLSERMAEAEQNQQLALFRGAIGRGDEVIMYRADLQELGEQREELNQRQIDVIRPVLLPEQAARLPEWDFKKDPPRRRWNYDAERAWKDRQRDEEERRAAEQMQKDQKDRDE